MKFAEFFFKIRDGTEDDGKLFDYEIIIKPLFERLHVEFSINDIEINHEEKRIYIWIK